MQGLSRNLLLLAFLLMVPSLAAENPASPSPLSKGSSEEASSTAEAKTVITSDRLDVINTDEGNRFIFSGSVRIEGDEFTAECDQMEVRTDSNEGDDFGAIAFIEGSGNVTIHQDDRIATAGRVLIYPRKDEIVLEDNPSVRDARGSVSGYRMILRGKDRKISIEPGPDGEQPRVELPSLESIREK